MKGVKSSGKVTNTIKYMCLEVIGLFQEIDNNSTATESHDLRLRIIFQVVYFTATFPYVILIALLVRGCMLEGAVKGLEYLFVPKWEKLLELQPWRKAAEQMFFSLGIRLARFTRFTTWHGT